MIDEYETKVVPGMKNAIICCLLCAQEQVEERKVYTCMINKIS